MRVLQAGRHIGRAATCAAVLMLAGVVPSAAGDDAYPTPEFAKSFVVRAVAGDVLVCANECEWLKEGNRRVAHFGDWVVTDLSELGRRPSARLVFAQDANGHESWADISQGDVEVLQDNAPPETQAKIRLRMINGDFAACDSASASKKKHRPDRPGRILAVRKHGPIVSESDRSGAQTSGTGTAWIVRDFCDYSEIEAVDGLVKNATTEVEPQFRNMRPGDKAKQACRRPAPETVALTRVRSFCMILYSWTTSSFTVAPGVEMPAAGTPAFSFRSSMRWDGRATVVQLCRRFPEYAETCRPLRQHGHYFTRRDFALTRSSVFCLPNRAGTYVFRLKVAGVQIGPKLAFDVAPRSAPWPVMNTCLPKGSPR